MIVRTKVKMQWLQPQTCSCRRSRNSALQNATSYKIACTRLLMRVTITTTNQILWISFLCFFSFSWCFFCCCCCCCRYALFSLQCNAAHTDNDVWTRVYPTSRISHERREFLPPCEYIACVFLCSFKFVSLLSSYEWWWQSFTIFIKIVWIFWA